MKCVKLVNGNIVRVSNGDAAELVKKRKGEYTSKSEYKRFREGRIPVKGAADQP